MKCQPCWQLPLALIFLGGLGKANAVVKVATRAKSLAAASRQEPEEPEMGSISYQAIPNIPSKEQELAHAREAANEAAWASSEAHAAAAMVRTSEVEEQAVQHELDATQKSLESKAVLKRAKHEAEKSIQSTHKAEDAAMAARKMEDEIKPIAMAAAKRAVKEVVAKAVEELNAEAGKVRDEALAQRRAAMITAAKEAQKEALPYQQAKLKAEKNMLEYLNDANMNTEAVKELKLEAMNLGKKAVAYNAAGKGIIAQHFMIKAHAMMDRAMIMERNVRSLEGKARSIPKVFLPLTLAAGAAVQWGAFTGNPAGIRPAIPPLPKPLKMPPVPAKG